MPQLDLSDLLECGPCARGLVPYSAWRFGYADHPDYRQEWRP